MRYAIDIELDSYIGQPYWPEMDQLVTIQKVSGMNRARTTANANASLQQELEKRGMTLADYEALERQAHRPFYMETVANGDRPHIVIARGQVSGMLVAATDMIRAAGRPCPPDQVRTMIRATPWVTDRYEADGLWERYVVVSSGTGAKLSNQRGMRRNEYIGRNPIDDTGTVAHARGAIELRPRHGQAGGGREAAGLGRPERRHRGEPEDGLRALQAAPLRAGRGMTEPAMSHLERAAGSVTLVKELDNTKSSVRLATVCLLQDLALSAASIADSLECLADLRHDIAQALRARSPEPTDLAASPSPTPTPPQPQASEAVAAIAAVDRLLAGEARWSAGGAVTPDALRRLPGASAWALGHWRMSDYVQVPAPPARCPATDRRKCCVLSSLDPLCPHALRLLNAE